MKRNQYFCYTFNFNIKLISLKLFLKFTDKLKINREIEIVNNKQNDFPY